MELSSEEKMPEKVGEKKGLAKILIPPKVPGLIVSLRELPCKS